MNKEYMKKKVMEKKILIVAAIIICITLISSGSFAFFTEEETAHNVITSGGVDIKIIEKTKDENGNVIDFPEEGMKDVMPGAAVSKIVSVKNTGKKDAWVRVQVHAAIIKLADGSNVIPEINPIDPIEISASSENWIFEDGYYYYDNRLEPDEETEVLFDQVTFASQIGNDYQNSTANIVVSAYAVQSANNGNTVLEAEGWPSGE